MLDVRLLTAALLLAGCATAPADPPATPARRCARWWLMFEPRLIASVGLRGGVTPGGQLIAARCARRESRLVSPDPGWYRLAWSLLASFAGAITALSFRPYKSMSRYEIAISLTVGTSFATFVGPLVATWIFGSGPVDVRMLGAVFYMMASGSNVLIPLGVRWLSRSFGEQSK